MVCVIAACAAPPAARLLGPPAPGPTTPLDAEARRWVERTLAALTLREKVAQLVVPWIAGGYASTASEEFDTLAHWVGREGVGGVAISVGLPHAYAAKLNALQRLAKIPLLVTSDFEYAGPGTRLGGVYALPHLLNLGGGTMFPPTMAFGAIGDERFAYELGRISGVEARAVGVHLTFAPVLDVNSNPENPIINTRSFAEDPELVGRLGAAFIRGAHAAGLLTTGKHFPGHGDTETDSHIDLPTISADRERLEALELVPFRRAIAAGVDAIMTAHIAAPEILGPDAPPATLSSYFLRDVLRDQSGFEGVIFTDAMTMGAIVNRYGAGEAAVLALEAGADIILFPAGVTAVIDALTAAVQSGRLSEARIDVSVRRMLELKARAGVHRGRLVDLEAVDEIVGRREHTAFADTAAQRSITLPRDRDSLIPLDTSRIHRVFSVVFARREDPVAARLFHRLVGRHLARMDTLRADYGTHRAAYDSASALADSADLVLVSVYVSPQAWAGTVGVPETFVGFVNRIIGSRKPLIVISFGNPYLLTDLPDAGTYLIAWGGREVSQRAAAQAVLGQVPITGRLPISLPPFHRAGEGLVRSAVTTMAETPLPMANPSEVGMDPELLARVDRILEDAIADSATPGAALAVGRHGKLVRLRGYGRLDWKEESPPVTGSAIYDIASLTKAVGTTTAIMILREEGTIDLAAPVSSYLAWFRGGGKERVTVRQLLLHRGGLPAFYEWWREMRGREDYRQAIASTALVYPPGDSTVYSDIGFMTLGFLVEERAGEPLDVFLRRRVLDPLGMHDTGFRPDPSRLPRTAPTEVDTVLRRVHVHGVVHDENAYAMGGVAGHAGLFSSARDLAVFAQMMLNGGRGPGRPETGRILKPETIAEFTVRYDSASSRALGWDTPSPASSAGDYLTARAFGHTGFTGTSLWIDPELDLFVVLLTNRVNPTRENQKHTALRRAVHDAVAQAITDRPVAKRAAAGAP